MIVSSVDGRRRLALSGFFAPAATWDLVFALMLSVFGGFAISQGAAGRGRQDCESCLSLSWRGTRRRGMAREKHISGERQRSVRRLTLIACPAGVSAMERQTGLGWRQGRNVGKQSCPFEHFRIRVRFTRRPYRPATGKIRLLEATRGRRSVRRSCLSASHADAARGIMRMEEVILPSRPLSPH